MVSASCGVARGAGGNRGVPSLVLAQRREPGEPDCLAEDEEGMTLTVLTWIILVLLAGAPLIGILAVIALSVYHEHKDPHQSKAPGVQGRAPSVQPSTSLPAIAGRRASTAVLECYLDDERAATAADRESRHARLVTPIVRASAWALQDHLELRAGAVAPAPIPLIAPESPRRVVLWPARLAPTERYDCAPRATRLMPLSPEIAIG